MTAHLLTAVGLVLAALGLLMSVAPGAADLLLRVAGVRRPPHPARRFAARALVVVGLVVALLGRAVG